MVSLFLLERYKYNIHRDERKKMKTTSKKMLSLLCLGMLASTVGNTLASAEVIDNGNGTLTIDNSNGT